MSNIVLSRKYRPQSFAEVVGQEHVTQTLKNAISSGTVGHAYLFAGPRGTGKTSIARLLAKALNCQNRQPGEFEPCNQCNSCVEITRGNALDLIEIDAASNRGIDEIRDLKDGIRFLPSKSKFKVFIIDEVHQLTKEAANALLKTLEEPPTHAIFILATTEAQKMISTILSRCQSFYFRTLRLPEIVSRLEQILKQEKIKYDKSALDLIAFSAGGALRDAETLLNSVISLVGQDKQIEQKEVRLLLGAADNSAILRFLFFLKEKQTKEAISFLNDIMYQGVDIKEFTRSVIQFLRTVLLLRVDPDFQGQLLFTLNEKEREDVRHLAKVFSEKDSHFMLETFLTAENKMRNSPIVQLPLELAVVDICLKE